MFSKVFLLDSLERMVKTMAQSIITLWGASQINLFTIDWEQTLGVSVGMGLLSVLMSVASAGVRDRGTASLVVNPPTPGPDTDMFKG